MVVRAKDIQSPRSLHVVLFIASISAAVGHVELFWNANRLARRKLYILLFSALDYTFINI